MSRSTALIPAVLLALFVSACGQPSGSSSPASSVSLPTPSATSNVPTSASVTASSSPLSSGAADLLALIPDKIGAIAVQKQAMSGEEFVGSGSAGQEAQAFLDGLGVSADAVSVAIAFGADSSGNVVAILLFQADGVSSDRLLSLFKQAADRDRENPLDWQSAAVGGKTVERAMDPKQQGGSIYLYATGDLLAFVTAGSDDIAAEALSKVP